MFSTDEGWPTVIQKPKKKAFPLIRIVFQIMCFCLFVIIMTSCGQGEKRSTPDSTIESAALFDAAALNNTASLSHEDQAGKQFYDVAEFFLSQGKLEDAAKSFYQAKGYADAWDRCMDAWGRLVPRKTIAAGGYHAVGVRNDGTVLATGDYSYGQCATLSWSNVIAVDAGTFHTVGLTSDGHVLFVGRKESVPSDISAWSDVVAVKADNWATWGLKADGTVLSWGRNDSEQDGTCDWKFFVDNGLEQYKEQLPDQEGLVKVSGDFFTGYLGLKEDGTVVTSRNIGYGLDAVSAWSSIVEMDYATWFVLGLRTDGVVLAAGRNEEGQCDTAAWSDIRLPAEATKMNLSALPAETAPPVIPAFPKSEPIYTETYLQAKEETLETWRRFLLLAHQNSPELPALDWSSSEDYMPGIPLYTAQDTLFNYRDREIDYWTCDLDGNGYEELIIGSNAIYCFDGLHMQYVFRENPLGQRNHLYRYDPKTKSFFISGTSGATTGGVGVFQFSEDGYSVSPTRLYRYDAGATESVENLVGNTSYDEYEADQEWIFSASAKPWYTLLNLEPEMHPVREKSEAYCTARDEVLLSWHEFARMLRDGEGELAVARAEESDELLPGITCSTAREILNSETRGLLYIEPDLDMDGIDELVIVCGNQFEFNTVAAYVFDGQHMKPAELPDVSGSYRYMVFIKAS